MRIKMKPAAVKVAKGRRHGILYQKPEIVGMVQIT